MKPGYFVAPTSLRALDRAAVSPSTPSERVIARQVPLSTWNILRLKYRGHRSEYFHVMHGHGIAKSIASAFSRTTTSIRSTTSSGCGDDSLDADGVAQTLFLDPGAQVDSKQPYILEFPPGLRRYVVLVCTPLHTRFRSRLSSWLFSARQCQTSWGA